MVDLITEVLHLVDIVNPRLLAHKGQIEPEVPFFFFFIKAVPVIFPAKLAVK
tara:strand:+ start:348 stop:503 length:156 start_codon:yes stop_codon:yes gene_type:complete